MSDETQKQIDITIKYGVKASYDLELGLTGRNIHLIITRLANALEERDNEIEKLKEQVKELSGHRCVWCGELDKVCSEKATCAQGFGGR